jgi:hypothetical protein
MSVSSFLFRAVNMTNRMISLGGMACHRRGRAGGRQCNQTKAVILVAKAIESRSYLRRGSGPLLKQRRFYPAYAVFFLLASAFWPVLSAVYGIESSTLSFKKSS